MPTDMGWTALVLIKKVNEDTMVFGMLEVLCKVVEAVINTRIKSVV